MESINKIKTGQKKEFKAQTVWAANSIKAMVPEKKWNLLFMPMQMWESNGCVA